MKHLLRLPIDQYERYRLVADLADRMRDDGEPLRVLDVGGRTGLLCEFLPQDEIVRVDMEVSERPEGLVLGDGARLPFASRSFDLVTACDTLEHVPVGARQAFVDECERVSAGHVILVGPFASSRVREAEARLREFLALKLDLEHRYLNEHADHGLPRRRQVSGWFEERGAEVQVVGHGNLQRWLALMCLEIYLESDPDLQRFAPSFYEFYNAGLYSLDARGPVYRHALVASVAGATPPDLGGLFDESSTPPELFEAVLRFAPDLGQFDRARAGWDLERERFETVVSELRRELDAEREHGRSVLDLREGELTDRDRVLERAVQAERHVEDLTARVRELDVELERAHRELAEQQVEIDRRGEALERQARELEEAARLRAQAVELQVEIERRGALIEHQQAELQAGAEGRELLERDRAELADEVARRGSELDRLRGEHTALQVALDRDRDERQRLVAGREQAAASFGHQIATADLKRDAAERALAEIQSVTTGSLPALRARLAALHRELSATREVLASVEHDRGLLREAEQRAGAEIRRLASRAERLERQLVRAESQAAGTGPRVAQVAPALPSARANRARGRRRRSRARRR
ncbi:MAG: methyltransferase domain-containing protein [Planctomycetota bacterium]